MVNLKRSGLREQAAYLLLGLVILVLASAASAQSKGDVAKRPLIMGVLPFMSPIALFKRFAPLRDYLGTKIGRTVLLETAKDYPAFVRRANERRYDILLTAPHFVLLALDSGKYRVQATYSKPLAAIVLVRKSGNIRHLSDLAGKVVATPPPEAIITVIGRNLLTRAGLTGPRAPLYRNYPSHNAAYNAVIGGDADAAITTINVLQEAVADTRALRVLARSRNFPALGILTARDLPASLQQRIGRTFINMTHSAQGRAVLKQIAYPGYRPAQAAEFETLRPYLKSMGLSHGPGGAD